MPARKKTTHTASHTAPAAADDPLAARVAALEHRFQTLHDKLVALADPVTAQKLRELLEEVA